MDKGNVRKRAAETQVLILDIGINFQRTTNPIAQLRKIKDKTKQIQPCVSF